MTSYYCVSIALALSLLSVAAPACNGEKKAAPSISCPSGTELVGKPPPDGEEMFCRKTVNGEQLKDGPYIIFRENGMKMLEGQYKDGKQDGTWSMWYEDGQKKSEDHYVDGVQQGEHLGWYENGQLAAKGDYKNGEPEGTWKRWGPDGVKNWEEVYKDGKKISG